jgi:protein-S-isoprenylcysteine O-methyltransferase Ste14
MDGIRHALALLLWVAFPPALGFWLLLHPCVRFWRRLGPVASYAVLGSLVAAGMAGLYALRERALAVDLGTRPALVAAAIVLLGTAAAARWRIERELTTRVLLGLPELSPERHPSALVTTGPYAVLRHPRYAQLTLALLGWALLSNYLVSYLIFGLWLPVLWATVLLEERELRDRFGAEWDAYARRVPRFLPRRR